MRDSAPKKSALLDELKTLLKARGFRKTRTTWHRLSPETIAVFNVQTSQWDSDDYYINVGICIRALEERLDPLEYQCHVRRRVGPEGKSAAEMVEESLRWFEARGTLAQVKALAEADSEQWFVDLVDIRALK